MLIESVLIAAGLLLPLFLLTYRIDLGLADEGYLWYGIIRTLEGKIPIRDFRAYDPGRYYWCAFWMRFLGRGILALRVTLFLCQFIAVVVAIIILQSTLAHWILTGLGAAVLMLWMFPRHKPFEHALVLIAIFLGQQLISHPNPLNFGIAGAFASSSLFIGLNHGLYNGLALSTLSALLWLKLGLDGEQMGAYFSGILLGAVPQLLYLLLIPGMLPSYIQHKIQPIVKRGTTNLKLPIPWLWRPIPSNLLNYPPTTHFFIRLFFSLMPFFYGGVILWTLLTPNISEQATLVASGLIGFFYMHHAFSRADLGHLGQSIHPLLIGLIALLHIHPVGWGILFVLLGIGTAYGIVLPTNPYLKKRRLADRYVFYQVGNDQLWLMRHQVNLLNWVEKAVKDKLRPDETPLLVPNLVGLYPIIQREAPMYNTYAVHVADETEQADMLAAIQHSRLAIVNNAALDGQEQRRFENIYPQVWAYLQQNFEHVAVRGQRHMFYRD